jgi:hypothetical protein
MQICIIPRHRTGPYMARLGALRLAPSFVRPSLARTAECRLKTDR